MNDSKNMSRRSFLGSAALLSGAALVGPSIIRMNDLSAAEPKKKPKNSSKKNTGLSEKMPAEVGAE